jgi:hypothetical protein
MRAPWSNKCCIPSPPLARQFKNSAPLVNLLLYLSNTTWKRIRGVELSLRPVNRRVFLEVVAKRRILLWPGIEPRSSNPSQPLYWQTYAAVLSSVSETSAASIFRIDSNLHSHRCESLKSHKHIEQTRSCIAYVNLHVINTKFILATVIIIFQCSNES